MADLLLLGFIAGFARGGWSTGFLRRLVGLAYIALSFVVGAYLRQPVGAIVGGIFPQIPEPTPTWSATRSRSPCSSSRST